MINHSMTEVSHYLRIWFSLNPFPISFFLLWIAPSILITFKDRGATHCAKPDFQKQQNCADIAHTHSAQVRCDAGHCGRQEQVSSHAKL
jgi:hypothetical protein